MSAGTIEIVRGTDVTLNFTFTNSDGSPYNLTGATVFLTVKSSDKDLDSAAIISLMQTNHTNPTQGLTSISIPAATTAPILPATYFYDLKIKDVGGLFMNSGKGIFTVDPEITQRTA